VILILLSLSLSRALSLFYSAGSICIPSNESLTYQCLKKQAYLGDHMEHVLDGACFVVSDRYKFIQIKHAKTAGSSIIKYLKEAICNITYSGKAWNFHKHCNLTDLHHGQDESRSDCTHVVPSREKWMNYFVWTIIRNPWCRHDSMVDYCKIPKSECNVSRFKRQGIGRNVSRSKNKKKKTKMCGRCSDAHCDEYGKYVLSPLNKSYVDFVGRMESLSSSFGKALEMIALNTPEFGHLIKGKGDIVHVNKKKGVKRSYSCSATVKSDYPRDTSLFGYYEPTEDHPTCDAMHHILTEHV